MRNLPAIKTWLRAFFLLALAVPCYEQGSAEAAEFVVFEARHESLRPGQVIDGNSRIQLAAGQRATLISPDGIMLKLAGPFEGQADDWLAKGGGGVFDVLRELVTKRARNTAGLGVTRKPDFGKEAGEPVAPPGPWAVDVTAAGDWCYLAGTTVVFWHPGERKAKRLDIARLDQSWKANGQWPAGSPTFAAPPDMPIADNAMFWFTVDGKDELIKFRAVPKDLPSWKAQAAWMARKNCVLQALALLDEKD